MRSISTAVLCLALVGLFSTGMLIYKGGALAQGDVTAETGYKKLRDPDAYGTVLMQRTTRGVENTRPVLFPHWVHRTRYTCSVCHADLKVPFKAGDSVLTHAKLTGGESCGACHNGTTAFSTEESCDRCHSYGVDVPENKKIGEALGGLPKDAFGNRVNWVKALDEDKIKPSAAIEGRKSLKTKKNDIILPVTKFTPHPPDVKFPHRPHSQVLKCESCHPKPFKDKKGGNPEMSMLKFMSGQYCGVCHGRVSFPLGDCFRCHSQPPAKPEKIDKKK